jgi:hypothetical protein
MRNWDSFRQPRQGPTIGRSTRYDLERRSSHQTRQFFRGDLKSLEEENRKLKKLLAESMLDVATLREALGKNF